jgi:hypothetical protein
MGEVIVEEVLNVLRGVGDMIRGWNETFIVLTPKMKDPARIKDLRPIILCNVLNKLVSKMFTNRLKIILLVIIYNNQSVFVPRRLITNNILMAYEATHFLKNKKRGGESYVVVKTDI